MRSMHADPAQAWLRDAHGDIVRYPGQDIPVTRRDWLAAVDVATEIFHWAQTQVDGIRKTFASGD
jgi:hypothetical protein